MRLTRHRTGTGIFLLEALLALLVFSLGTAALLGVAANAQRDSGNARWRGEAFDVAFSTLSRMWSEDPAGLAARYDAAGDGAGYRTLLAAAMALPGVDALVNPPIVTIDDEGALRRVSVTVYWQGPSERSPHRMSVSGALPRN